MANAQHNIKHAIKLTKRIEHAKIFGVTISNNLTWNAQVECIVSKAGKLVFMLYQLKRAGVGQRDILNIYVYVIRPVLEYACQVVGGRLGVARGN